MGLFDARASFRQAEHRSARKSTVPPRSLQSRRNGVKTDVSRLFEACSATPHSARPRPQPGPALSASPPSAPAETGCDVFDDAAIYCRISKDEEGDAHGVANQEEKCRKLAYTLGFEVGEVFTDNDIGASDKTGRIEDAPRPSYDRMLADVRSGRFNRIVAYSNSRITRRMLQLEELIQLHEETGAQIFTVVSGNDDLSTADGQRVARIKASVDAAESARIS
ncbi:recombinase family protein [Pseudoclavibacter sp. 13-3]|uniref:recombinase family protein n=1 Tax=Pseudoclavibacter sp. 13-3 TaxID=2901228 RepID=UPI001E5F2B7B|nr:recombinase family protein [Pseudoclavibacter sp. 13-3]MCD7102381.1 recombinase family protein [Pseudoclavibacter sp. 13-3]